MSISIFTFVKQIKMGFLQCGPAWRTLDIAAYPSSKEMKNQQVDCDVFSTTKTGCLLCGSQTRDNLPGGSIVERVMIERDQFLG